jgi:hypothetical protein
MRRAIPVLVALAVLSWGTAEAVPIQNLGNGHYYELGGQYTTWQGAVDAAAAMTYNTWPGYLVTVTSNEESEFIYTSVTSSVVWAGGSDAETEGVWKWITGPEAGTVFWNGGPGGSSPTYARWNGGEPNNLGNEDFLHLHWSGPRWNDIPSGNRYLYVIEYSEPGGPGPVIPEPGSMLLLGTGLLGLGRAWRKRRG